MILDDDLDLEEEDDEDETWLDRLIEDEDDEGTRTFLVKVREARRQRQRREWDKLHLATVSTRVTVDEGRRFRRLCRALRTTRYKVLAAYVRALLDKYGY